MNHRFASPILPLALALALALAGAGCRSTPPQLPVHHGVGQIDEGGYVIRNATTDSAAEIGWMFALSDGVTMTEYWVKGPGWDDHAKAFAISALDKTMSCSAWRSSVCGKVRAAHYSVTTVPLDAPLNCDSPPSPSPSKGTTTFLAPGSYEMRAPGASEPYAWVYVDATNRNAEYWAMKSKIGTPGQIGENGGILMQAPASYGTEPKQFIKYVCDSTKIATPPALWFEPTFNDPPVDLCGAPPPGC
jgi:hypothetical protein